MVVCVFVHCDGVKPLDGYVVALTGVLCFSDYDLACVLVRSPSFRLAGYL